MRRDNDCAGSSLLALLCLAAVLSGCWNQQRDVLDSWVDQKPGIRQRPAVVGRADVEAGQRTSVLDIVVVLPGGWSVLSSKRIEEGGTEMRIKSPLAGSEKVFTLRIHGANPLIADPPQQWMVVRAGRFVTQPEAFLRKFASDYEFLKAVTDVTPDDRDRAEGQARQWARFLLEIKGGTRPPGLWLDTDELRAFLFELEARGTVHAYILDRKGRLRCNADLDVLKKGDPQEEFEVLRAILGNSRMK